LYRLDYDGNAERKRRAKPVEINKVESNLYCTQVNLSQVIISMPRQVETTLRDLKIPQVNYSQFFVQGFALLCFAHLRITVSFPYPHSHGLNPGSI
jgi:hypothetical protein